MVFMPSESQGPERKLARPFHGPYRILALAPTNAEVRLVDDPKQDSIFMSLDRVCSYPDTTWTGPKKRHKKARRTQQQQGAGVSGTSQQQEPSKLKAVLNP